jgi:hypothetical protein
MVSIIVPAFIVLLGALVYGFSGGKLQELGRLMFLAGMLAIAFNVSSSRLIHF